MSKFIAFLLHIVIAMLIGMGWGFAWAIAYFIIVCWVFISG